MKRIISLILAIVMFAFVMTGCKNSNNENPTEAPDVNVEFNENVVAIAGDYEITLDEINVFAGAIVPYIQQSSGSNEGWENIILSEGKTARDVVIEYAIDEARYQHAFLNDAREMGVYSAEEEKAYFQEYITTFGGEELYKEFLEEYNFTDQAFRKYVSASGAYYAVADSVCTDEEAIKAYNEDYITAKHILIVFEGRDSEDDALKEAKIAYERAKSGENFEALITELNEDPGEDPQTGYTFTVGEMVDEFYEGAKNLKIGEISEPIRTTYGYHVIKRYELPDENTEMYESYISSIKNSKLTNYMTDNKVNEMLDKYPLTINESILNKIDLSKYTTVAN